LFIRFFRVQKFSKTIGKLKAFIKKIAADKTNVTKMFIPSLKSPQEIKSGKCQQKRFTDWSLNGGPLLEQEQKAGFLNAGIAPQP